jgi:hypothetical protein
MNEADATVNAFTLDPEAGEFVLSHKNVLSCVCCLIVCDASRRVRVDESASAQGNLLDESGTLYVQSSHVWCNHVCRVRAITRAGPTT